MYKIVEIAEQYRHFVDKTIENSWSGPYIVSKGVVHDTRTQPGYVAVENGEVIGLALYNIDGAECELTVLESMCEKRGIGSMLIREVARIAKESGCRRVWLVTTNDNTAAIRFYQKFGFELRAVHIGAIELSRVLKPQIPMHGIDRIPIKHEFEFELAL